MLLSDIETAVRQDLFDPAGGPNQRWQNSDIDRAIDKAVDRYSQYYPNIAFADLHTQPFQRTYPYPQSWNSSYPVWWIERILYPLQVYGSYFAPPPAGMTASAVAGSGLGIGSYSYTVTFLSQGGETTPSPLASVTTTSGNQQVNLASIPLGPANTSTPGVATNIVIGRNLYRSLAGGLVLYLLATLPDNTTTTYTDAAPDSALADKPSPPAVNTSGVMLWPPFERDFAEYSNIFDSTAALAAGGNLGAQGNIGSGSSPESSIAPSFTLKLSSAELPQDATSVIRVFYATKHQLDASGSTIPEVHRDIIVLGASAYAMEAYQVPTNDNFDFQDGALRDRVDDTQIPTAWLTAAQSKMQQFEARLQEIKNQRDFTVSSRVHWGDIAARYERL
ncbi:MAG TPA: hypothetical protein VFA09_22020 [Ktedonobacteraceae bacterium]|nr:hypothetical protein [Ktedonobacteraceae bacterium]